MKKALLILMTLLTASGTFAQEKETGVTIHKVNEEYDKGEIVGQVKVPVLPSDTPEILANRVLEKEHEFLVEILSKIAKNRIK